MKTVFIIMDSLNRHMLPAYGNDWVQTPNISRLAQRGVVFDNHYSASLPCMPARRDLMNGRYNFLETPWGPLEPYDDCLPSELRRQKLPAKRGGASTGRVYSHMITDHYHYWEWYGQGYHCFYDTWEFMRGQEGDAWYPRVRDPETPCHRGRNRRQDWINRANMNLERDEDYPTPQCFQRAMDFLDHNHDEKNWFLHLEVFDPHEPFISPKRYRDMYGDVWTRDYHYDWPDYNAIDPKEDTPDVIEHIRKCYAATLTMGDAWFGRLLDRMDRYDMWRDTTVILTTDHGHLLGEHGYWAKNYMFDYNELVHIPLIIATPDNSGGQRRTGLTSAIDMMPTILEMHGASPGANVQGQSMRHLLDRDEAHHDAVLYGYFAKDIGMTDGRYTYCRQPRPRSITHHHTAMPANSVIAAHRDRWATAEMGHFLRHATMPVYRVAIPSHRHRDAPDFNPIYDLRTDPRQERPINDPALEEQLAARIRELLIRYNAPACQFERTDLRNP
jgi:arylsulfatase A-like enzyme